MTDLGNHAIHPGGTPLNSNPDPDANEHDATEDQPDNYVDPVTRVNHAAPVTQAQLDADEAANE